MKKTIAGIFMLSVLMSCGGRDNSRSIVISTSFALYPMFLEWSREYRVVHPEVEFDIAAGGASKSASDILSGMADLGSLSRETHPGEIEKGLWSILAGRDAVVPVINENNPFLAKLLKKGVTGRDLAGIWRDNSIRTWDELTAGSHAGGGKPISVYNRSDSCGAKEIWALFLGAEADGLSGVGVFGEPGMTKAVKDDPLGIGYNNIHSAFDSETLREFSGVRILPLDLNGNGFIDPDENIYSDRQVFLAALLAGQYPSPPSRNLYIISKGTPARKEIIEFLYWIMTDGQKYVSGTGYFPLNQDVLKTELKKLPAVPVK